MVLHLAAISTFPNATVLVAISKINESPSVPGAAELIGFVPSSWVQLLGENIAGVVLVNDNPFANHMFTL